MDISLILQINKVKSESRLTNTQINFYVDSIEEERTKHKVVHTLYAFCFFEEGDKRFVFNNEEEFHKVSSVLTAVYTTFGLNYYEVMKGLIDEYRKKGLDVESRYSFSISAN